MSAADGGLSPELAPSRAGLCVLARALRGGGGDRRRGAWVAAAIAGAGAVGCGIGAIVALPWSGPARCQVLTQEIDGVANSSLYCTGPAGPGLARYLVEPGLRVGLVAGALCLVVPFLLLTVQALRFGTAARERRLAALAVAGAGRAEVRRLGALEAVYPAMVGSAFVPALYLALWFLLGRTLPFGWRMLPTTPWSGLLAWPVVAAALIGAAAWSGARAARPAVVTLLGSARRAPRPMTRLEALLPLVLVVGFATSVTVLIATPIGAAMWVAVACLVGAAVAAGTPMAAVTGWFLVRRGAPAPMLTGRRLLADPRTPGRVGGVLMAVGIAIGIEVGFGTALVAPVADPDTGSHLHDSRAFFLFGLGAALLVTLVAAASAVGSLTVGAAEHVLDTARPTAALVALGASRRDVAAVLRLWLWAASLVPTLVGTLFGAGLMLLALAVEVPLAWALGSGALAVLLSVVMAAAGSAVAGLLLRPAVTAAASAESLRTT